MYSILQFLLLTGCSSDNISSPVDTVVERTEENTPNSDPEFDDPWSYQPDKVLFHNVAVVTGGDQISCFDDGDDLPYCGVHKIILTVWEDYEGLSDDNNCQIIHRVAPENLTEIDSDNAETFSTYGTLQAWEFDASKSLMGTTSMCDLVAEDSDIAGVIEMFKTQNVSFGYRHVSEDMEQDYREAMGSSLTDEEWDAQVSPYLVGMMSNIDGVFRTTNIGVVYEIDQDNQLVVDSDDNLNTLPFAGSETLPDGYYRVPPFWVYNIDRFFQETSE